MHLLRLLSCTLTLIGPEYTALFTTAFPSFKLAIKWCCLVPLFFSVQCEHDILNQISVKICTKKPLKAVKYSVLKKAQINRLWDAVLKKIRGDSLVGTMADGSSVCSATQQFSLKREFASSIDVDSHGCHDLNNCKS